MNTTFGPPPGVLQGWPGCRYPEPLQKPGFYEKGQLVIWYVFPIVHVVVGTFGNIVTSLVIFRARKVTSTTVVLLALAFSDTVFLISAPLRNWLIIVYKFDIRGFTNIGCKIAVLVVYSSYQASSWFLVVLTAERLMCILKPHKVKLYFTPRNSMIIVFVKATVIVAQNSHLLYGFGNKPLPQYESREDCLIAEPSYVTFYVYYLHWIHFTFGYIVPCLFIIIGNSIIIYKMRRSFSTRKLQVRSSSQKSESQFSTSTRMSRQRNSLTVMLVMLNLFFFVSQTPLTLFLILEPLLIGNINRYACVDFEKYTESSAKFKFTESIVHNLGYLNASINFVLYVVSGSRFRKNVKDLLLCRSRARAHAAFSATRDDSLRSLDIRRSESRL